MRVFITGVGGFVGRYLLKACLEAGDHVSGLVHRPEDKRDFPEDTDIFFGDLLDFPKLSEILSGAKPDVVYHLGGISSTRLTPERGRQAIDVNVSGTMYLLEAISAGLDDLPKLVAISSSQVYGRYTQDEPLTETLLPKPSNLYSISKASMELVIEHWAAVNDADAIICRSFNHTGPGQTDEFVVSSFTRQFAEMLLGRMEPVLHTGNLDVIRDFTDVRDVVHAYRLLAEKGRPNETYNVGSGVPLRIGDIIACLEKLTGISVTIEQDPTLSKRPGVPVHLADVSKLKDATDWEPQRKLEDTLQEMVLWWREQLENE